MARHKMLASAARNGSAGADILIHEVIAGTPEAEAAPQLGRLVDGHSAEVRRPANTLAR